MENTCYNCNNKGMGNEKAKRFFCRLDGGKIERLYSINDCTGFAGTHDKKIITANMITPCVERVFSGGLPQ